MALQHIVFVFTVVRAIFKGHVLAARRPPAKAEFIFLVA